MRLTFDIEAPIKNKANPYTASNFLVSYSYKIEDGKTSFKYYTDPTFLRELKYLIPKAKLIIGFAMKIDLAWASRCGVKPSNGVRIWDAQIAEFIISGQKMAYPSLDACLAKYGLGQKDDKIKEYWDAGISTEFIPVDELEHYGNKDVDLTYLLYLKQQEVMTEKQKRLCTIMCLDLLVLQEMEENGVKFDVELCKTKAEDTAAELALITAELYEFCPTPYINLDSGQHLSCLLFGGKFDIDYVTQEETVYKSGPKKGQVYLRNKHDVVVYDCPRLFEPLPKSETKLKKKLSTSEGEEEITIYTTNEDTLKQLKKPTKRHKRLIELLLKRAELAKLMDTYYKALPTLLEEMEWGEYIHSTFNQVVARTGRLSSSKPNAQNFSGEVDQLLISRYS